jgi:hypothetical protein
MRRFLEKLRLEELPGEGPIDSGAEEELFRDVGRQAAAEVLRERWERADAGMVGRCDSCGGKLRDMGLRAKVFRTLCGPMKIRRRVGYCCRCREMSAGLDKRLGADATGITPGLRRVICRVALELAYEPAKQLLRDTLGMAPCSAREIERIATSHGSRMNKPTRVEMGRQRPKRIYCVAIDGTMVPGRPDPSEHRVVWHEVKLATLFDARDVEAPFYVAGLEGPAAFGQPLWGEVESRGLDGRWLVQVIGDGAPWIWNLAELHFPKIPQLLDFYHAAEHLHLTATALWPAGIANRWWHRRLEQLKAGELGGFFSALKFIAKRHETMDPEASPERLLGYFEANRQRLGYAEAKRRNLPIGSGSVESAGRHIVQQRLKQSGMRWSIPGAQAVLNLRTRHRSGQFEDHWESLAIAG